MYSNFSVTRPVNPPGAEPKLTEEQLWKSLERKVRNPSEYVPATTSSVIVDDKADKLIRDIAFQNGVKLHQEINLYEPSIIYLDALAEGSRVINLISYDKNNELLLTVSFVGGYVTVPNRGLNTPRLSLVQALGARLERMIATIRQEWVNGTE